jgi:hypothetical protein
MNQTLKDFLWILSIKDFFDYNIPTLVRPPSLSSQISEATKLSLSREASHLSYEATISLYESGTTLSSSQSI